MRKRLYFDLETSPNIGFFWTAGHKLNIGYENIIKERAIICICYKWEGEKKVHSLTWDKNQCDKKLLTEFVKVANEADELVGHNGDAFDLPWVRTRCLFHRIDMFPTYTTIDTLKIARYKFNFNSNRLNYIASYLGIGKKIKTEFDLWKDIVLNKSETALNKMVAYCKQDVILLENVHKELRVHDKPRTHFGVIGGKERGSCPECGSDKVNKQRVRVMASGTKQAQFKCTSCGKYHSKTIK
jgi:predicted PolB exonuclease-like 3'-5' exonuclease